MDQESEQNKVDSEDPILAMESARFSYGRRVVLDKVDLSVGSGEFWCFVGPNGEGKTTLIKGIIGALRPAFGRVAWRADFANRTRIGFVPQSSERRRSLPTTVREFVLSGLAGLTFGRRSEEKRLERVLEIMGISALKSRQVDNLSGGQFQRAIMARALARDPLLMVVDEPTAGLDPAAAERLLSTITELNQEKNITVVFVTHQLEIVRQRASHVALFRNRRVAAGQTAAVFTEENLRQVFGADASENSENGGGV